MGLDNDITHGVLREPLLKLMHLMRAMQLKKINGGEFTLMHLSSSVGQDAFLSPTVFSFYLPDHAPAGPIGAASLVAPEAMIGTTPRIMGFLQRHVFFDRSRPHLVPAWLWR